MKQDEEYLLYKKDKEEQIGDWESYYCKQVIPCADIGLSEVQIAIFPWTKNRPHPGVFEGCAAWQLLPIGVVFEQYFQLIQQWSRQPLFEKSEDYSLFREVVRAQI